MSYFVQARSRHPNAIGMPTNSNLLPCSSVLNQLLFLCFTLHLSFTFSLNNFICFTFWNMIHTHPPTFTLCTFNFDIHPPSFSLHALNFGVQLIHILLLLLCALSVLNYNSHISSIFYFTCEIVVIVCNNA
jgi:hypothetical protein